MVLKGFAGMSVSTSPADDTSNVVILTNKFSSYPDEKISIYPDGTTTTQITCFTPAMNPGKYLVQVIVMRNIIPAYQYLNNQNDATITVNKLKVFKQKKQTIL